MLFKYSIAYSVLNRKNVFAIQIRINEILAGDRNSYPIHGILFRLLRKGF